MPHLDLADNKIKNVRAVVWKVENGKKFFLITQELAGNFTIPGGCKDLEDSDLLSAMKRELREELGLSERSYTIERLPAGREYPNLYNNPESERFGKNTIMYLFVVNYNGSEDIKVKADEIKGATWLNEDDAMRKLTHIPMKEMFQIAVQHIA